MGKRKNGRNGGGSRTKTKDKPIKEPFYKRISRTILWLAATGLLAIIGDSTFAFFTGDVHVEYIKPSGRGYEFKLINKNSTDQVIKKFRISPDLDQQFVFKITDNVIGEFTEDGVSIPGGNVTHMPAYEYKEMDGYILQANSEVDFRIPPLVARNYMSPESMVVFAEFSTISNNKYFAKIESILAALNFREDEIRKKYLVADNYWTPIGDGKEVNAIKSACRDDDQFAKSSVCKRYNK